MKILFKAEKLFLVLGLTIAFSSNDARASGIYPIATNAGVVLSGMDSGVATSGTNYLVSILAGTNVCVQLVSTSGTLIGPLLTVGVGTSFPQVAFGGGNYLVYWDDNFATSGPYGQIVSGNGNKIGLAFLFGSVGVSAGAPRALAFDGVNFLVIWQGGNSYYGQFATPAGNLSGPAFLINGPTSAKDLRVVFATTNYFLAWQQGSPGNIYGAFLSKSGSLSSPFQISQTASLDHNPLAIAFDGANYFLVWNTDSTREASGRPIWNLYGRLVSPAGTVLGSELVLNTNQPLLPSLAFDGVNYLLAWSYNLDTTNSNKTVYYQFLNRSASPVGPVFTLFQSQGTNSPLFGGVLFDGNRFAVVADIGFLEVGSDGGIHGFGSGAVYGAFVPKSSAPPQLIVTTPVFSLLLTGTPGINYAIQASTNLAFTNWTALATNSPTNGSFKFIDSHATNANRFYRALKQ